MNFTVHIVSEPRTSLTGTMSRLTRCFVIGFVLLLVIQLSLAGKHIYCRRMSRKAYFIIALSV